MNKILVIGGGAAGLMAAVSAAQEGAQVTLLEKMPVVGKKLLITGKGRCNITNSCDMQEFIKNILGNGPFLYSAFRAWTNQDMLNFLGQYGLETKIERGGRVFPVSDKARDVVETLKKALKQFNVDVRTGQAVKKLLVKDQTIVGVLTADGDFLADKVILATGGASYPGTGSNGEGYKMAEAIGHRIVPLKPSLVPLEVAEEWIADLQGVSLKNVTGSIFYDGKKMAEDFGEMLFTHYGLSGPIVLTLSSEVAKLLTDAARKEIVFEINLKPALAPEVLDKRVQRDFEKYARKQFKNALHDLLPAKMIETMMDLSHIDPEKPVHQITKEERSRLAYELQHLSFTITGTRPLSEAIVTAGGVHVKEINPKTMESKLIRGLFFAGEVIDIDGFTGGFNLQAAFSTGHVAGKNAAE